MLSDPFLTLVLFSFVRMFVCESMLPMHDNDNTMEFVRGLVSVHRYRVIRSDFVPPHHPPIIHPPPPKWVSGETVGFCVLTMTFG